jgi:hypothetical protein
VINEGIRQKEHYTYQIVHGINQIDIDAGALLAQPLIPRRSTVEPLIQGHARESNASTDNGGNNRHHNLKYRHGFLHSKWYGGAESGAISAA